MSNFRKFTEFCAGIAAFAAIMYVFRQFMSFDFEKIESFKEKLKYFFSTEPSKDYRPYILLALLFIVSISISLIFKRRPEIAFFFSALPLFYSLYLYDAGKIYERPMLFICLSIIEIIGNIYDSLMLSRKKKRSLSPSITAMISCFLPIFACGIMLWRLKKTAEISLGKLYPFDQILAIYSPEYDMSLLKKIAITYAVLLIISLVLRGVHFVNLALSCAPLGFILYKQAVGLLGPYDEIILAAAILCTATQLAVTLGDKSIYTRKKE